jgi:hypothetical protein
MTNLTRRSFLKQTSATLGLLPCLPALAAMPDSPQATTPGVAAAPFSGPIIAHVSDLAMGEVTLLVGAREIIFRDPQFVAHLMKAARRTSAHSKA